MPTEKEVADAETRMESEQRKKQAVATYLGVNVDQLSLSTGEHRILVTVEILYRNLDSFVEMFTPPFKIGDKVKPTTVPVRPRYGKKKDELTDYRKRTVEEVIFDHNTRTWWILLKGNKFGFTPEVFRLIPPRA